MMAFAELFGVKLNLIMINTPNSFKPDAVAEKIMQDFVRQFPIDKYSLSIYNDTNVEKGIMNFAK